MLDYADPYAGVTAEGDDRLYRFLDREGQSSPLRADFTPMAARVVAPRLGELLEPVPSSTGATSCATRRRASAARASSRRSAPSATATRDFAADEEMLALLLSALGGLPAERLRITLGCAGLLEACARGRRTGADRGGRRRARDASSGARASAGCPRSRPPAGTARPRRRLPRSPRASSRGSTRPRLSSARRGLAREAAELARAVAAVEGSEARRSVVVDLADSPDAPYYTGLTFSVDAAGGAGTLAAAAGTTASSRASGCRRPRSGSASGSRRSRPRSPRPSRAAARPLRIAVGKGRLLGKTLAALREGGAAFGEPDGRRLLVPSADGAYELLLLKDDDVPTYVAHGGADLGVVGSDRVAESGEDVFSPVELPFGACRLSLIGRGGGGRSGRTDSPSVSGRSIGASRRATSTRGRSPTRSSRSQAPSSSRRPCDLTDVVVDLIETGSTIAANGLAEIETIETSRATVILGRTALVSRRSEIAAFLERLREKAAAPC